MIKKEKVENPATTAGVDVIARSPTKKVSASWADTLRRDICKTILALDGKMPNGESVRRAMYGEALYRDWQIDALLIYRGISWLESRGYLYGGFWDGYGVTDMGIEFAEARGASS